MTKYFHRIFARGMERYLLMQRQKKIDQFKRCGVNFALQDPFYFTGYGSIEIGDNVGIAAFAHIWGEGGVTIGHNVLIASHAAITSITHNPASDLFSKENIFKPVVIGNNVWIGSHTVIMPGVTIGNNCIIGAGSVVNKNIPDGKVYAGVPVKELYELDQFK